MTDERWLRDALHRATAVQPPGGDVRADGALRLASARRKQRLAVASCTAVLAVFMASSLTGGGTRGLEPAPVASPSGSETPVAEASPSEPSPGPGEAEPTATSVPEGWEWDDPGKPIPPQDRGPWPAPEPMAIDVYFLFDVTASAQPYLNQPLSEPIVRALRAGGHDVRYGYGTFRDKGVWNVIGDGEVHDGQVYQRMAAIQPAPGPFSGYAYAGGDPPEAHTMGLMGAFGWTDGLNVRDPQPAGFRAGAKKFIVMVTNSPMHSGGDYPTIEEAVAELNEHSVWGIPIQFIGNDDPEAVRAQLDRVAAGTHAIAPRTVDCDGDDRFHDGIDVRRGDPLVCTTYPGAGVEDWSGLANAMIALASGGR